MTPRMAPADTRDIDAIMAIMARAFAAGFGEAWTAPQVLGSLRLDTSWARIAWAGAAPVGFTLCRRAGPEAELLLIGVDPAVRRGGIGAALLRAAQRDARDRGAATMFLEVRDGNAGALALYAASGFFAVGRRPNYYHGADGVRFDALTLRAELIV